MIELVIGIFIGLLFRFEFFKGTLLDPKTRLSNEQIDSLIKSHKRKLEKDKSRGK